MIYNYNISKISITQTHTAYYPNRGSLRCWPSCLSTSWSWRWNVRSRSCSRTWTCCWSNLRLRTQFLTSRAWGTTSWRPSSRRTVWRSTSPSASRWPTASTSTWRVSNSTSLRTSTWPASSHNHWKVPSKRSFHRSSRDPWPSPWSPQGK